MIMAALMSAVYWSRLITDHRRQKAAAAALRQTLAVLRSAGHGGPSPAEHFDKWSFLEMMTIRGDPGTG